jgi:hypothetical protein
MQKKSAQFAHFFVQEIYVELTDFYSEQASCFILILQLYILLFTFIVPEPRLQIIIEITILFQVSTRNIYVY